MYAAFFGLRELPFNNTPDPRFFFSTSDHDEALASLIYTVQERKGVVLLTGEIGAGKTLLSRMMLRHFGSTITFAHITHAVRSAEDLTESVCTELEIPYAPDASHAHLIRNLHDFLLNQFAANKPVVLVLDEAQNLPLDGFEQLRMVGNLEADDAKLLQIVIVGQPELRGLICSPALRQLRQRICRSFHLGGMTRDDIEKYINHRLSVAGAPDKPIFDKSAIDRIAILSGGLPRVVNTICDSAMLNAYAVDVRTINGASIDALEDQIVAAGAAEGRALTAPEPAVPVPAKPPVATGPATVPATNPVVFSPPVASVLPPEAPVEKTPVVTLDSLEKHARDVEARLRMPSAHRSRPPVALGAAPVNETATRMCGELSRLSQEVQGRVDDAIDGLGKLGRRFTKTVRDETIATGHDVPAPPEPPRRPPVLDQAREEGASFERRQTRLANLYRKIDSFLMKSRSTPLDADHESDLLHGDPMVRDPFGWNAFAQNVIDRSVSGTAAACKTSSATLRSLGLDKGSNPHATPPWEPSWSDLGAPNRRTDIPNGRADASNNQLRPISPLQRQRGGKIREKKAQTVTPINQLVAEADLLVSLVEARHPTPA